MWDYGTVRQYKISDVYWLLLNDKSEKETYDGIIFLTYK